MSTRLTAVERSLLYSPAWLIPLDILTGAVPPLVPGVALDLFSGGQWVPTGKEATTGPSGVISYPALGRARDPLTTTAQRYRARFDADPYDPVRPDLCLPLYRAQLDGMEFIAFPYDDTNPPTSEALPTLVKLSPTIAYTFPWDVPVLYGSAVSSDGSLVPDVLVEASLPIPGVPQPLTEQTITDRRGAFVLPLRWAQTGADIVVMATDQRSAVARRGSITVRYPAGLPGNHLIEIR